MSNVDYTNPTTAHKYPTAQETQNLATLAAKNGHSASSLHQREEARMLRPYYNAPFPSWAALPENNRLAFFADNTYLEVCPSALVLAKNKMPNLPKADRAAIQSLLGGGVSIQIKKAVVDSAEESERVGRGETTGKVCNYGKRAILIVNCATNRVDPQILLELNKRHNATNCFAGGWMRLNEEGALFRILNQDWTQNVPGAIKPTRQCQRKPLRIGGMYMVAKNNAHYNGFQCVTYTIAPKEDDIRKPLPQHRAYTRYCAQNEDGDIAEVVLATSNYPEFKFYNKVTQTISSTSTEVSAGNNMSVFGYSTHPNVNELFRDVLQQTHGNCRMEWRFPSGCLPTTPQEVLHYMEMGYNAIVDKYLHSENIHNHLEWHFDAKADQVALVQEAGTGFWNATIVRMFNTFTGRYNTETIGYAQRSDVIHFLTAAKLRDNDLHIYWQVAGTDKYIHYYVAGPTNYLPNLEYLSPAKYEKRPTRAMWAQTSPADVGLDDGAFQITNKPTEVTPGTEIKLTRFDDKQPDFTSIKKRKQLAREWWKILMPKKRGLESELVLMRNGVDRKKEAREFSRAPKEAYLLDVFRNRAGNVVVVLQAEGSDTTGNFLVSEKWNTREFVAEIKAMVPDTTKKGKPAKEPAQKLPRFHKHPYLLVKGEANTKGIYEKAKVIWGDTEEACLSHDKLLRWELLTWTRQDWERCKEIVIR